MTAARKIRALIVDDEELARALIREYLTPHDDVEIVAECRNGLEAVRAISAEAPNLLFLDVQMPKLDGFDVIELAPGDYSVIFTTAFDEYALKAFEVNAIDYLLKPFTRERFDASLARVRSRKPSPKALSSLVHATRERDTPLTRILVRDGTDVHVIPVGDIDFIEAQDDYVSIRSGRSARLKQQRLAALEKALDPASFVRIHRSYILNIDRLARIELFTKDSRVAILKDGTRLPVSKSGYERLKALL